MILRLKIAVPMLERANEKFKQLSRCGTVGFEKENGVTKIKMEKVMTKFAKKSLHSYPMAFYYLASQSFDGRIAEVESELTRLNTMR